MIIVRISMLSNNPQKVHCSYLLNNYSTEVIWMLNRTVQKNSSCLAWLPPPVPAHTTRSDNIKHMERKGKAIYYPKRK
jgi:hypothetical protein